MKLTAQNTKLITAEIAIMKSAVHPNVVDYYDSYLVDESVLWVSMELMSSGSITDILDAFDEYQVEETHIARICLDVGSHSLLSVI